MAALATNKYEDPEWLQSKIVDSRPISSINVESMAAAGGLNADMQRIRVKFEGGDESTYVLKQTHAGRGEMSKTMGLEREALFYNFVEGAKANSTQWAELPIPKVLYAEGDPETGLKILLMEDLSDAVQSGYFFDNHSPHNWGKDMDALTKGWMGEPHLLTSEKVTIFAFEAAAKMHATYWNEPTKLSELSWLRGVGWLDGKDEASWVAYQKQGADCWATAKGKLSESEVSWDPNVIACLDASIAKATPEAGGWLTFQSELKSRPQTLVHGDFHPANMMICDATRLVMLDFEQVGVGSGPQDLGQYFISHALPSLRKEIEHRTVTQYYEVLLRLNPSAVGESMSFELCWKEYVDGGIGRWCWMLPLLATMCPPKMVQYFHDQCKDFMDTHNLTPENIPMPRV